MFVVRGIDMGLLLEDIQHGIASAASFGMIFIQCGLAYLVLA